MTNKELEGDITFSSFCLLGGKYMELPHCYENTEAVQPFFKKAKDCLPYIAFLAIQGAYSDEDKMFKVVALTHIKNYFKKSAINKETVVELISLLDTFRDPYQDFLEKNQFSSWAKTKNNILGGMASCLM